MDTENWIAIVAVLVAFIGTIITPIVRRFRRHSIRLGELFSKHDESTKRITKLERNEEKMSQCVEALRKEVDPKIASLHEKINRKADITMVNNFYDQLSNKLETMNQNIIQLLMLMRKDKE